jgi:hypothetical protein
MPLVVTIRTTASSSSRQVGLHLTTTIFILPKERRAEAARERAFFSFVLWSSHAMRFHKHFFKALFGVLLCQFLSGVTNARGRAAPAGFYSCVGIFNL